MRASSARNGNAGGLWPAALCAMELGALLGLVPLAAVYMPQFMPRRALLFIACAYALARLWGKVSWKKLFARPPAASVRWACLRGALAAGMILAYMLLFDKEHLLDFPRNRPLLWLAVFCLYPALSALPQEIIYRLYVFECFAPLRRRPWAAVAVSALAFGWLHVIYTGWFAVAASTPAGLALAWAYRKHRAEPGALAALALEHSLYGLAVFTLGLGRYFYLPH